MPEPTTEPLSFPSPPPPEVFADAGRVPDDPLTACLRDGARKMLIQAVEAEVAQWVDERSDLRDADGRRQVVRNGYADERTVVTGLGPMQVKMPRAHDRRPAQVRERFTSKLLPPYLRKAKAIDELIPWLYLKGVSTGGFNEALQALLGHDCPGLSASTVNRLTTIWQHEQAQWAKRDLSDKQYVYVWADGIHLNIRLEEAPGNKQCILVLMGATADGKKELIAVEDGHRESEQSWKSMLLDLKSRGLMMDPKLAIADGALGFWTAMRKVWTNTKEQRCWVHKTANVLKNLPKTLHSQAKDKLHAIWMAPGRDEASQAFDLFIQTYEAKYPKATQCLTKDRDELLTFYDFPAEHWVHLRTTNPIESAFATVRLRHKRTKGNGSRKACLAMFYKLAMSAEKRWRKLNGHDQIPDVIAGVRFTDGVKQQAA